MRAIEYRRTIDPPQVPGQEGSAAEFVVVPARPVVPLPDSASFDLGAGGEVTAPVGALAAVVAEVVGTVLIDVRS